MSVETNDILVIENGGAYGYAMSSNYNLRERPAEVLVRNPETVCLIRKRETLDSILSNVVYIWVLQIINLNNDFSIMFYISLFYFKLKIKY